MNAIWDKMWITFIYLSMKITKFLKNKGFANVVFIYT